VALWTKPALGGAKVAKLGTNVEITGRRCRVWENGKAFALATRVGKQPPGAVTALPPNPIHSDNAPMRAIVAEGICETSDISSEAASHAPTPSWLFQERPSSRKIERRMIEYSSRFRE
jgi:hypothetical protein